MNTLMMGLGYTTAIFALAMIVLVAVEFGKINGGDGFICTVFKFGFVYAKPGTLLHTNLNRIRKTEDQQWFMSVPAWFKK